jgi:hypothetical protein
VLIGVLVVAVACAGRNAPDSVDLIGQWEKQDGGLPPINLTVSVDGDSTVARLRLSGSELNGTAVVDGARVRLDFPDRPAINGQLVSSTELKLRLNDSGPDFTLTKLDH